MLMTLIIKKGEKKKETFTIKKHVDGKIPQKKNWIKSSRIGVASFCCIFKDYYRFNWQKLPYKYLVQPIQSCKNVDIIDLQFKGLCKLYSLNKM